MHDLHCLSGPRQCDTHIFNTCKWDGSTPGGGGKGGRCKFRILSICGCFTCVWWSGQPISKRMEGSQGEHPPLLHGHNPAPQLQTWKLCCTQGRIHIYAVIKKGGGREKKEGREHKLTLSRCKCTAVDPTLRSRTKPTRSYGPSCTRPGHSVCTGSIWVWSEDSPRANASTTAPLLVLPLALGNIFSSLLYCTLSAPPPLCRAHCRVHSMYPSKVLLREVPRSHMYFK